MHCTVKKTTQLIVEGGNDYIVTVKDNQPRLLAQLHSLAKLQLPCERFVDVEQTRGRTTCRIVNVFANLDGIDLDWMGLQSLIQVERIGIRAGKQYLQTQYGLVKAESVGEDMKMGSFDSYFSTSMFWFF